MTNTLPIKAKVMIGMAAAASLVALSFGVARWQRQAWPQLVLLLLAAVLSSRLKVKVPGMTSSMSGNLPVILLGVVQVGLLGSLLIALVAAVSQSYTSDRDKTRPVQFVFNACTLMNAAALAYLAYHSRIFMAGTTAPTISLVLAIFTYFLANTAPVASIIGMTEGGNPFALWHKVFLWSFPNYVIGAGLTAMVSIFNTVSEMFTLTSLLAVLFGIYQSYKTYVGTPAQAPSRAMATSAASFPTMIQARSFGCAFLLAMLCSSATAFAHLREELGLTGSKVGRDTGHCGV